MGFGRRQLAPDLFGTIFVTSGGFLWVAVGLLSACNTESPEISLLIDQPAMVATVAVAGWNDLGESTRVEVTSAEGQRFATEWQDSSDAQHEATLLGLLANTEYAATVATASGPVGEPITFVTGPLPTDMPAVTIAGEPGWQGYVVTTLLGETSYAVILDEQGQVVWYAAAKSTGYLTRARLRRDGAGVRLGLSAQNDTEEIPYLFTTNWLGEVQSTVEIPGYSHDFVEKADGTLAFFVLDPREVDGYSQPLDGDLLVEMNEAGETRTVFDTWDHWPEPTQGTVGADWSWTHANALDLNADETTYSASFRGLHAIVDIDAATGALGNQLGGPDSSYRFNGEPFVGQHQFQRVDGGIVVFDNRTMQQGSRAAAWTIDNDAMVATEGWSIEANPATFVYALGDVDLADDGGLLVAWSSAGLLTEHDAEGELRWSFQTELGTAIGFIQRVEALPGMERLD